VFNRQRLRLGNSHANDGIPIVGASHFGVAVQQAKDGGHEKQSGESRYDQAADHRAAQGGVLLAAFAQSDGHRQKQLKKRTLTNLYNERPMWLQLAHRRLDEAVFAAYGWDLSMSDDDVLAALLALNLKRAAASTPA
jgi:hypothetical protein